MTQRFRCAWKLVVLHCLKRQEKAKNNRPELEIDMEERGRYMQDVQTAWSGTTWSSQVQVQVPVPAVWAALTVHLVEPITLYPLQL